jgi:hypothetical protein
MAHGLAANPAVSLRTKVQKELGLSPDVGGAALGDAMVVGLTYMDAAVVPLWPYVVLPLIAPALIRSLICTLVALFALGVCREGPDRAAGVAARGLAGHADRFGKRCDRVRHRSIGDCDHGMTARSWWDVGEP